MGFGDRLTARAEGKRKIVIPRFLCGASRCWYHTDRRKSAFKEKDYKMSFRQVEFEITVRYPNGDICLVGSYMSKPRIYQEPS